jgi:hypothetical protein
VTDPAPCLVILPVDADYLAAKVKATIEEEGEEALSNAKLWEYVPKIQLGQMTDLCTLVARHGSILLWYLPGIMSHRLVSC